MRGVLVVFISTMVAVLVVAPVHAAPPPIDPNDPAWQRIGGCMSIAIEAFLAEQRVLPEYQPFQDAFAVCGAKAEPELSSCFTAASVRYAAWQETLPGYAAYQRAVATCYIGTPYERLVPKCARPDAAVPCPDPTAVRKYFDELGYSKVMEESFAEFSRRVPSLTTEQANELQDCLWDATWDSVEAGEPAGERTLEAYGRCYAATPGYEPFVRTYTYGAAVAACARRTIGATRIGELGRSGELPIAEETALVRKCAEATVAGATAVAVVNTVAGVGPGTLLLYGQFLLTSPAMWLAMRRRKSWGTVVNGLTETPIDLAVVRLLEGARLRRTQVTDAHGRYLFVVNAGSYHLAPNKDGYQFPITVAVDGYRGQPVSVPSSGGAIQEYVPMEPVVRELTPRRSRWQRVGRRLSELLAIAAPVIGIGAFAFSRTWLTGVLALLQIAALLLVIRLRRRAPRAIGTIRDAAGKPVVNAIVRLFRQPFEKLAETQVTTRSGRYGFLVGPGTYAITAEKPGVGIARVEAHTVRPGAKPTALGPTLTLRPSR